MKHKKVFTIDIDYLCYFDTIRIYIQRNWKKNGNGEKLEALELSELSATLNILKNLHKLMK